MFHLRLACRSWRPLHVLVCIHWANGRRVVGRRWSQVCPGQCHLLIPPRQRFLQRGGGSTGRPCPVYIRTDHQPANKEKGLTIVPKEAVEGHSCFSPRIGLQVQKGALHWQCHFNAMPPAQTTARLIWLWLDGRWDAYPTRKWRVRIACLTLFSPHHRPLCH